MKIETGKYLLMPAIITILEFLKAVWEGSVKFITFGNIFFESTPYWVIGNATGFWGFCKYPKTCTRLIYLLNNQYWFNYLQYAYYLYCWKATILVTDTSIPNLFGIHKISSCKWNTSNPSSWKSAMYQIISRFHLQVLV